MIIEIKAPTPGESITEVQIANWLVKEGDFVPKDSEIAEIDSDKATLTVNAETAGTIHLLLEAGETVAIGTVIATIDTSAIAPIELSPAPLAEPSPINNPIEVLPKAHKEPSIKVTPLARKIMEEKNLSGREVLEQLGHTRITRQDVLLASSPIINQPVPTAVSREIERKKLSTLRIKLAQRLVSVKNETAMLTTFNEVNMSQVMALKKQHNDSFKQLHGVGIGFMSFFTKAVTIALAKFPQVNAMIDGDELILHRYADIGIAVSAPKGLVVPIIRNAEALNLAQIEIRIKELATKARDNKLTIEEMTGGTFTITNGGVFGSLMSTPILNPPQSAILGMHNIVERPIALNGQVAIAPMMYIALSYDHRVIDGRESVSFLLTIKDLLENPTRMLFEGNDPLKVLLGI